MDPTTKDKLDKFFVKFKNRKYRQGEVLIRGDENPPGVLYLVSGTVQQYDITKQGNVIILNIIKPPAIFPMSWVMNDVPNSFSFEAMEPVELWMAPQKETIALLHSQPDILFDLLRRAYRGTDDVLQRMTHLMAASAYNRVILELIISSKLLDPESNRGKIKLSLTASDLAERTGLTRETISRELQKLKAEGLVRVSLGTVVILDLAALEDEHGTGI